MKDLRSRYGFHTLPFTREIRVEECLSTEVFDEALQALLHVLEERMSAALIGPAGTGKTTLLRALVETHLPEARYRVHYVEVSGLSKRDMCREIALAAGVSPAGSFPVLVRNLHTRFVSTTEADGLRSVLILDNAHELRPDTLGMLRVLTNYDMDSRLVLSIILAGQPPLRDLLRRDVLDDVARRLAHYATLRPLSRTETASYIKHRCTVAGATVVPFDTHALDAIYEIGRGNIRATDQLARKTLHVAHDKGADVADNTHVIAARKVLWP
jgi:type II secretory pathway predicted ATPase ExeA